MSNLSLRDELQQLVWLYKPRFYIFEWIPFDPNIFEEIAEELEAKNREKGILLTDEVDSFPEKPVFVKPPVASTVSVVDYEFNRVLKLEAFIGYPEVAEQVERIGIEIRDYGSVIYGLQIQHVDEEPNVSLDKLARIIFDVIEDTSRLMSSILSLYQRRVLNIIYPGYKEEGFERRKYTVVISEKALISGREIDKEEILNTLLKEPFINEVKQIVGPITSYARENGLCLINGSYGMLILGKTEDSKLLSLYASVKALEMFLEDLLVYLWMVWEKLGDARKVVLRGDVKELKKVRVQLVSILSDFTLLKSIMGTITYSLDRIEAESKTIESIELNSLGFSKIFRAIRNRCKTIGSLFESIEREIDGLLMVINTHIEEALDRLNTLTFWLSIIFGSFGLGQLAVAIAPWFMEPVESTIVSSIATVLPIALGLLLQVSGGGRK